MSLKLIVIIVALIGGLYSLLLSIVTALSANNPTPKNLEDVYDAETYEKWKKYSGEHSRLNIISAIVTCAVTVLLIFTNAYAAFASLFPHGSTFWQVFAVILLESVVGAIVSSVFGYISTMKIEEKYGFNRSTIGTFIKDKIKSFVAGFLLSVGIVYLIGVSHNALGVWMIPVFAVVAFAVTMLISFLYPLLSRLGNKFTPLEDGDLKDALMGLLNKYGYKVKAIEVMDASKRTTKLNAYFTGFGKMKTIVLYDNLIEAMSTEEICAVFAHELGHGLNRDVQKAQILNVFQLLLMAVMACGFAEISRIYLNFGFAYLGPYQSDYVNYGFTYVLLGIGLGVLQPLTGLVMNARSRRAEFRADKQAVLEGYGEAMISALKKLARDNFSHLAPSFINVVLEYSHPPLNQRVKNVEKEMRRLKRQKNKK